MGVRVLKTAEINGTGASGYLCDGVNNVIATYYGKELKEKQCVVWPLAHEMAQVLVQPLHTGISG